MMKYLKALISFIWRTHFYVLVLVLLTVVSNNTAALFGYLASFIFSSLAIVGLLLMFRTGWRLSELLLPGFLFGGVVYWFIHYFYLSGRTELYWLGLYAAGLAVLETIKHLYRERQFFETLLRFPLASHLFSGFLALGVWFFVSDFTAFNNDNALLTIILLIYAGLGILIEGLQVLAAQGMIGNRTIKKTLNVVFMTILFVTTVSILASYFVYGLTN